MDAGRGKRILGIALAVCAASLALAACGGDDDSGDPGEGGGDQFTTAEFQKTLDEVERRHEGGELLEVAINTSATDYQIRDGEQATGLRFAPGSDDPDEVEVELIGTGTIEDTVFPISEVDPAAIDKILAAAPGVSGVADFEVTAMKLARENLTLELKWTINGEGGGRTGIVLTANPDGSGLASPTGPVAGGTDTDTEAGGTDTDVGGGTAPPTVTPTLPTTTDPEAAREDVQAIAKCIQQAGGDVDKIRACAGQ